MKSSLSLLLSLPHQFHTYKDSPMKDLIDSALLGAACERAIGVVRLFKLSEQQLRDLYEVEVYSKIPDDDERRQHQFRGFAAGYLQCALTDLMNNHCDWVYQSADGQFYSIPSPRQVVPGDRKHYSQMTMAERATASVGYVWKGSDTVFSTFLPTADHSSVRVVDLAGASAANKEPMNADSKVAMSSATKVAL